MRYIIQAIPDRSTEAIRELVPDVEVFYGGQHHAMKDFIALMDFVGDDAFVRLEDDIELTSNFCGKIESFISQHPNNFISFFTLKQSVKHTQFMNGRTLCMSQCYYFPRTYARQISEFYKRGWLGEKDNPTAYDFMIGDFLYSRKEKYILYQPSLVQHLDLYSAIDPRRSKKRQSTTFTKD